MASAGGVGVAFTMCRPWRPSIPYGNFRFCKEAWQKDREEDADADTDADADAEEDVEMDQEQDVLPRTTIILSLPTLWGSVFLGPSAKLVSMRQQV
jgi:hypothetical protein